MRVSLHRLLLPVGLLSILSISLAGTTAPGAFGTKAYPQLSEEEWNAVVKNPGFVPGDGGQYIIDADQCWSAQAVLYAGQDTGGIRTSPDHGQTWYTLPNHGLRTGFINGVSVDPLNPQRVLVLANAAKSGEEVCGLYLTTNGGLDWQRVLRSPFNTMRGRTHVVAYARSTMDRAQHKTLRVYCLLLAWNVAPRSAGPLGPNHELWTSPDGGDHWTKIRDLPSETYGHVTLLEVDPVHENKLYLSGRGLWRIDDALNATAAITKLSGVGGLPDEGVSSSLYLSPDGRTLLAGISRHGIYRSTDGGDSWMQTFKSGDNFNLQINPFAPAHMVMTYGKNKGILAFSRNGDSAAPTFATRASAPEAPGLAGDSPLNDSATLAQWLPDNPDAVALHAQTKWWRSLDGGEHWAISSAGFNGRNHTNYRPGAGFFDPTNPDRFILPMVDYGLRYTDSRGRWFIRGPIKAETVQAQTVTCNGGAIHPDPAKKTILVAASEQSKQLLLYSHDNGASFAVVSPERKRRQFVGFDRDDPHYAFNADEMSRDDGATWTTIPFLTENKAVVWDMTWNAPQMAAGQALFAIDLLVDTRKVWRSVDRGAHWELVLQTNYDLRPEGVLPNAPFKVHPANPAIIWTIDPTKQRPRRWDLSAGTPTTRSFTDATLPSAPAPRLSILFIDIDPKVPSVMYVVGWGEPSDAKLWRSTDSGATWTNLSSDLPGITSKGLAISPVTGEVFMSSPSGGIVIPPPYPTANTVGELLPWGSYHIPYPSGPNAKTPIPSAPR